MRTLARDDAAGAARFGARSLLALVVLVATAFPFLALALLLERQWAPLREADAGIAQALNDLVNRSPLLLEVNRAVTHLGDAVVAVYVLVLAGAFLWIRGQRRLVAYLAVTGTGLAVLVPLAKAVFDRARPVVEVPVSEVPHNASFPSGHAMTSFVVWGAIALVVLPHVRRVGPVLAAWVAVTLGVGLSRLFLGVHYVTDVVAGWSLGAAWLLLTTLLFRAWQRDDGRLTGHRAATPDRPAVPSPGPARSDVLDRALRLAAWASTLAVAVTVAGLLFTGLLLGTLLGRLDRAVAQGLADSRTDALTVLARAGSRLADAPVVTAVAVAIGVLGLALTRSRRPALLVAVALSGEALIYLVTSRIVGRPRPAVADLTSELPVDASWPSGHVAAAVVVYGSLAVLAHRWSRPWGVLLVAVALLVPLVVALARLYLGAHHLSDVLAGMLLGVGWLLGCAHVLPRVTWSAPSRVGRDRVLAGARP